MATESAADLELSVTLSPPLAEWLEERADSLGTDPETLLLRLLETHREAADPEAGPETDGPAPEALVADLVDRRLEDRDRALEDRIEGLDGRIDGVEAAVERDIEDVRNRVLQLRDGLEDRAPADHTHGELTERLDSVEATLAELSAEFDDFEADGDDHGERLGAVETRLEEIDGKLDALARAVVAGQRRRSTDADRDAEFAALRRAANEAGVTEGTCAGCGESVRIDLLTEAACPFCERRLSGIDRSDSVLRWFHAPTLTLAEADTETHAGAGAPDE